MTAPENVGSEWLRVVISIVDISPSPLSCLIRLFSRFASFPMSVTECEGFLERWSPRRKHAEKVLGRRWMEYL